MEKDENTLKYDERLERLSKLSNEELSNYQFTLVYNPNRPDDNPITLRTFGTDYYNNMEFKDLQKELWDKFNSNPQINSAVRDYVGRMVGKGFDVYSDIPEIQDKITEIAYDFRNRLFSMLPKYVGRSQIEGELFLVLTVHKDGFVEIDFRDPSTLEYSGKASEGILFHPTKPGMPLAYDFVYSTEDNVQQHELIPSIYVARYPELDSFIKKSPYFQQSYLSSSQDSSAKYKKLGGYKRFVIQWDKGWLTTRNISHIRTVLVWINMYEQLKKFEIDHKKSAGSYLWIVEMEDAKAFRQWLALSDEDRAATGLMAKKSAGGTMMVPPGMKMKAVSPQLPKISDSDSDILDFVFSGLNVSDDSLMGRSNRNKSSLSETHGTQTDRIQDEIANLEPFLRFDFWDNIFFLSSAVSTFKYEYNVMRAVDFDKNKNPIFKRKKYTAGWLIDFSFPQSQNSGVAERVTAYLGSKHGPVTKSLGIPAEEVAKRLGFSSYRSLRLRAAEEEAKYPELTYGIDEESVQEKEEAENKSNTQEKENVSKPKKSDTK